MACCSGCASGATLAGVDGGECDQPFVVTWPSDVDRLKARISPIAEALDAGVLGCAALLPADRIAWAATIAEWRTFRAKPTCDYFPCFGSYNEWVTACSYAHTFDAWRAKLEATKCVVPGPLEIQGADSSALKWLAGAVIVGGLAVIAWKVSPAVRAAVGR